VTDLSTQGAHVGPDDAGNLAVSCFVADLTAVEAHDERAGVLSRLWAAARDVADSAATHADLTPLRGLLAFAARVTDSTTVAANKSGFHLLAITLEDNLLTLRALLVSVLLVAAEEAVIHGRHVAFA